jgi:hypothetical protein
MACFKEVIMFSRLERLARPPVAVWPSLEEEIGECRMIA